MQKSGRGSASLSQLWSERTMWTTSGHVISSAGLTSRIRLKAFKTIAHGNTTFHSTNISTNIQDTLHFHPMMQKQEDTPQSGFLNSQRHDNVFEKIHTEEDVFQFIGSTSGLTTNAKDIHAELHPARTQVNSQRPLNLHTMERAKSWESRYE
ncbi:hypothetical protein BDV06DRAFT_207730 [Aspergillus oleicola]